MSINDPQSMNQQVMLKRVALFFGNAVGNAAVALITAVVAAFIMIDANVSWLAILIWLGLLVLFVGLVLMVEVRFDEDELTPENARKWLGARMAGGCLVSLMFGLAVYWYPEGVQAHHVMYIVLILMALVSLCSTAFAVMPVYTYLVSGMTIVPMLFYLLFQGTIFYISLGFTMLVIWSVLINKARVVSKSAIKALVINEKLQIEIHNHEQTQLQLDHMVNHDYLTGLPNRKFMLERLTSLQQRFHQTKEAFVVMYLDLDGFKKVNDEKGHAVGDWLLKQVAQMLQKLLTTEQMVARIGGDEFIVLAPVAQARQREAVDALQEHIAEQFAEPVILPDDQQALIGISIGLIQADETYQSAEELLQAADMAMYQNKKEKKC